MNAFRLLPLAGAALFAAGAVVLPAVAQPGLGRGHGGGFAMGEAFARADTNGDNQVSRDEGWAWLQGRFAEMDGNRDGAVTFEELRAFAQSRMEGRTVPSEMRERAEQRGQAMFRVLDANLDGRVTLEELRPFAEAMFRSRDANSDGQLSRDEVRPRRGDWRGHRDDGRGPGGERRGPPQQ